MPIVRRTKTSLKAAPVVESDAAGFADTRPVGDHEGVARSSAVVDDLVGCSEDHLCVTFDGKVLGCRCAVNGQYTSEGSRKHVAE